MSSDLIRIIVIGALAFGLYYLLSQQGLIKNQGEVYVEPEGYEQHEGYAGMDSLDGQIDSSAVPPPVAPNSPKVYDKKQLETSPKGKDIPSLKHNTNVLAYPQISNNFSPSSVTQTQAQAPVSMVEKANPQPVLDCYPKDVVKPQELLPKDDPYSTWNKVNPSVNGHLADKNFLESAQHFGINTVGSSLRNANLQLRSDPAIPMVQVGPWMQSTISADTNRRQFELGGDY